MKRRTLLQLGAGLAAAPLLQTLASRAATRGGGVRTVVVLLELRGGNDGLNTLAPHTDPLYRKARPRLALGEGIPLPNGLLLHPALAALKPAWEARRLAFALGVGWPTPNRSHFKATDQWATGQPSGEGPGWLAVALRQRGTAGSLVALGPEGSAALEGSGRLSLQMSPALLQGQATLPPDPALAGSHAVLRRLLTLETAGTQELLRLKAALRPLPTGLVIPRSGLGQQVALALRLIASGIAPPVLQLSIGGFDTHSNQLGRQARVLGQVGSALAAFDAGLQRIQHRPQVTLLATSEFGRRLQQNASGGTDHGSASVALLLGDHVPHPFLGTYPSLSDLDARGDLIPGISPPQLYQQALTL